MKKAGILKDSRFRVPAVAAFACRRWDSDPHALTDNRF